MIQGVWLGSALFLRFAWWTPLTARSPEHGQLDEYVKHCCKVFVASAPQGLGERLLADRAHDGCFAIGNRTLAEQRRVVTLLQDDVRPAQALHGLLGRNRAPHDLNQDLCASCAA